MNCSNCAFAQSSMSFGGNHDWHYKIKCRVKNEDLFTIGHVEATMQGVELLTDYRDPDKWYPGAISNENLDVIMPGPFDGWRDMWQEDRKAFFKGAILEPMQCICTARDIEEHIDWLHDCIEARRDKIAEVNQGLADDLQDLDAALVLVQALEITPMMHALRRIKAHPPSTFGITDAVDRHERTH